MDPTMLTKTDSWPSAGRDHLPSPKQSNFSNDFCLSTETVTVISSGSSDKTFGDCEPVRGTARSETKQGESTCVVETAATKVPETMNSDRLQTLFSEYERIFAGDNELQRERSETRESSFSESQPQPAIHEATTVDVPQRENSPCTNSRRSQRKSKNTQLVAGTGRNRIKKKRVSAGRNQEYEFLRLGKTRRASNGSIEYKVMWKPTWVALEDHRGERALEEAEELTVMHSVKSRGKRSCEGLVTST